MYSTQCLNKACYKTACHGVWEERSAAGVHPTNMFTHHVLARSPDCTRAYAEWLILPPSFVWVPTAIFTLWWNCLKTYFSEHVPTVKWHMSVLTFLIIDTSQTLWLRLGEIHNFLPDIGGKTKIFMPYPPIRKQNLLSAVPVELPPPFWKMEYCPKRK